MSNERKSVPTELRTTRPCAAMSCTFWLNQNDTDPVRRALTSGTSDAVRLLAGLKGEA